MKPVNNRPNDQAGQLHEDCEDGEANPNHPHRLPLPLLHEQLEHSREEADGIRSHQGSDAVHAGEGKEEEDPSADCVQRLKEQDKGKLEERRSLVRLEKDWMWVEDSNSVVHLHHTDADAVEEVEQLRGSKGEEDAPQPCNLRMKQASEYSHQNHLSSVGRVGERSLVDQVEVASRQVGRAEWQWLHLVMR